MKAIPEYVLGSFGGQENVLDEVITQEKCSRSGWITDGKQVYE